MQKKKLALPANKYVELKMNYHTCLIKDLFNCSRKMFFSVEFPSFCNYRIQEEKRRDQQLKVIKACVKEKSLP